MDLGPSPVEHGAVVTSRILIEFVRPTKYDMNKARTVWLSPIARRRRRGVLWSSVSNAALRSNGTSAAAVNPLPASGIRVSALLLSLCCVWAGTRSGMGRCNR